MLRITGVGGGTGLPALLRGFTALAEETGAVAGSVSAIVAVSDNGGSSGALRRSLGIPAVGDLRNCLVALAGSDSLLSDLFQFRFSAGDGLDGHALGNLIVAALCQSSGSLERAIRLSGDLLRLKGRVLPVTQAPVTLCARFDDASVARGESEITARRRRIQRVWLDPENAPPTRGVLQTITRADAIVLGPGSLYSSVIPNLLVGGVAEAIRYSQAIKIFVCNLMTEPGETDSLTTAGHLRVLESYLGARAIDVCLVNSQPVGARQIEKYAQSGAQPVVFDPEEMSEMRATAITGDFLAESESVVAHDPVKLARQVVSLAREARGGARGVLPFVIPSTGHSHPVARPLVNGQKGQLRHA